MRFRPLHRPARLVGEMGLSGKCGVLQHGQNNDYQHSWHGRQACSARATAAADTTMATMTVHIPLDTGAATTTTEAATTATSAKHDGPAATRCGWLASTARRAEDSSDQADGEGDGHPGSDRVRRIDTTHDTDDEAGSDLSGEHAHDVSDAPCARHVAHKAERQRAPASRRAMPRSAVRGQIPRSSFGPDWSAPPDQLQDAPADDRRAATCF